MEGNNLETLLKKTVTPNNIRGCLVNNGKV